MKGRIFSFKKKLLTSKNLRNNCEVCGQVLKLMFLQKKTLKQVEIKKNSRVLF